MVPALQLFVELLSQEIRQVPVFLLFPQQFLRGIAPSLCLFCVVVDIGVDRLSHRSCLGIPIVPIVSSSEKEELLQ